MPWGQALVKKRALALPCVVLVTAAWVAGCGSTTSTRGSGSTPATAAAATSIPAAANGAVNLGCSEYCQTAGGYGGDDTAPRPMIRLAANAPVRPLSDGTIPLTFTCLFTSTCLGTVFIDSASGPQFSNVDHGSDIKINGSGATRTIAVPLPSAALTELQARGRLSVQVSTDLGWSFCPELSNPKSWECLAKSPRSVRQWRALELDSWKIDPCTRVIDTMESKLPEAHPASGPRARLEATA